MVLLVLIIAQLVSFAFGTELIFELAKRSKYCFYETAIELGQDIYLDFEVVRGGHLDISAFVINPSGVYIKSIEIQTKTNWKGKIDELGDYQFCFSNEFSTFTPKLVYFDISIGDEERISRFDYEEKEKQKEKETQKNKAVLDGHLTTLESGLRKIRSNLQYASMSSRSARWRDANNWTRVTGLNMEVNVYSAAVTGSIVFIGFFYVIGVKRLFKQ